MSHELHDIALRLQAIIDTAIDGIIVIDSKGIIEEINQAALELFQYEKHEVVGQNVKILMPSPYHEQHDSYIQQYHETRIGQIIGVGREVDGLKKNGIVFPFRLAVSEVILKDRVIFTGIVHDLTTLKKAEAAQEQFTANLERRVVERTNELEEVVNRLLQTNEALENEIQVRKEIEEQLLEKEHQLKLSLQKEKDLNELKSRFLTLASHEFRTPLSTILSSTSLIDRYNQESDLSKRMKHTNRIKSAIHNLTGILNDFLSLGKLEEGRVEVRLESSNIIDIVMSVEDEIEGLLQPKQKLIVENIGENIKIWNDPRIIKNILFNIITNAIKFSFNGTDIICRVLPYKNGVCLEIEDSGVGIPINEQKHLFERFFRASNVETIQGTGLGLNIVKKYLELIQGDISFKSEPGEGTTFFIYISNYKH